VRAGDLLWYCQGNRPDVELIPREDAEPLFKVTFQDGLALE
jgi:hypothetical protein